MWSLRVFDRLMHGLHLGKVADRTELTDKEISDSTEGLQMIWTETALFVLSSLQLSNGAVLGISSAIEGEGKSSACLGLGVALARESNGKVLIVECEAGNSGVSKLFGIEPEPGLIEFIEQPEVEMERILRRTVLPRVDVVTIGGSSLDTSPSGPGSQLTSSRIRRYLPTMVTSFRDLYDFVMLDLPPLTSNAYGLDLSREADRIFLSVKADVTPLEQVGIAMRMVEEEKLAALLLMTDAKRTLPALLNGTARSVSPLRIIEIPEFPATQDRDALLVSALMGTEYEHSDMLDRTVRV